MGQTRLLELVAYSLGICIAAGLPLCWRLRWIFEAEGHDGLEQQPFAFWLPMALLGAMTTYVVVLASLAPRRLFFGTSLLLLGMSAILVVTHFIFNDVGSQVAEVATPFVIQLVTLGFLLGGARLLRFRLVKITTVNQLEPTMNLRFPIADLLLLSTALAVFLSMVHQFDFFWHHGSGRFQNFLWLKGLCHCLSSLPVIWAALSKRWLGWAVVALLLSPVGALAGWYAEQRLLYAYHWYGIFTILHAAMLLLLLLFLRWNQYRLLRTPANSCEADH